MLPLTKLKTLHQNSKFREFLSLVLFYGILSLVLNFPLLFELNSSVFGYTSDNFSSIWSYWALSNAGPNNHIDLVRYPLGMNLQSFHPEIAWALPFDLLRRVLDPIVVFNLFTLAGFIFSGVAMYYLIHYLTKDRLISFIIGLIFAFSPYHYWQGFVHINLGFIYTLPLYLLALIHFDKERSLKSGAILGLAFLFTTYSSFYYGYFVFLMTIVFVVVNILIGLFKRKNYFSWAFLKGGLVGAIIVGVGTLPVVFQVVWNQTGYGPTGQLPIRPLNDLLSLSMRPWDFFLPAPNHPVLGDWSGNVLGYIQTLSADFKTISAFLPERVVFIGWGVSVLGLLAFFKLIENVKQRKMVVILALTTLGVIWISAPPFIIVKGIEIKFPTYFIFDFISLFRVYSRLGILVLLLTLTIIALGLNQFKSRKSKTIVSMALILVTAFEFLPFGWGQSTPVTNSALYNWVKDQPQEKVFVEYPVEYDTADALIWQKYHTHKLFNSLYNDEILPLRESLSDLKNPGTWQKLKAAGVDYVIFHTNSLYPKDNVVNDFYYKNFATAPFSQPVTWANEIASFPQGIIYEPTGKKGKVVYLDGSKKDVSWFYEKEWQWEGSDNVVYLNNSIGREVEVIYQYQVTKGSVRNELLNGEKSGPGQILKLKTGINELVINSSGANIVIDNFSLLLK